MASVVTEFVCVYVCLFFFLYNSTLVLITEHGGEGEPVELIVLGEEGNQKGQPRNKWKWNEGTEKVAMVGGAGGDKSGLV